MCRWLFQKFSRLVYGFLIVIIYCLVDTTPNPITENDHIVLKDKPPEQKDPEDWILIDNGL